MRLLSAPTENWLNIGLGFLYPEICRICESERAPAKAGFVCSKCWTQVRFIRPPFCERCGLPFDGHITTKFECTNCREMELHFSSARAAVVARTVVLEIIHRFKYQRELWFESFLADLLLREALPALREADWDFIAPVPLHSLKEREREFNQAEHLARRLGADLGLPMNARLLRRVEPTRTQTLLTRRERAANVKNAFAIEPGTRLDGERIVIFDDVLTTGATTSACARTLRAAGAGEVCVLTIARGI